MLDVVGDHTLEHDVGEFRRIFRRVGLGSVEDYPTRLVIYGLSIHQVIVDTHHPKSPLAFQLMSAIPPGSNAMPKPASPTRRLAYRKYSEQLLVVIIPIFAWKQHLCIRVDELKELKRLASVILDGRQCIVLNAF